MNQIKQKNLHTKRGKGFFWEARTRILAWYLGLISVFLCLSIPVMTHLVLSQVETRVRRDLAQELEAFNDFQQERFPDIETADKILLIQLFQDFLAYKIPEDDTFLITIINGQLYRSSPLSRPLIFNEKSPLIHYWAKIEESQTGEWITSTSKNERVLYLAQPVIIQGKVIGVFVAAHIPAGEIQEAINAVKISLSTWLIALILAALAAWIASRQVLNPLQKLSYTVSFINESDLQQRIPAKGTGEIAQLTIGFNQMMERLEQVFSSQRELLNDIGHELRTPITIIRGHLELMSDDPQEQQETLTIAFDELDRMNRLVDNLILLAKAERPDFLQEETIDIDLFTQEIYTKITTLANRHWQLCDQGQGTFKGDRQRLTQAIINLAQNAVQHTKEIDTIIWGSTTHYHSVSFWIKDTGKGFAPEDQHLIFQRFARATSNPHHSEGQGLGLSIVQAIIQAHKGEIKAESQLGKGATFTIILPLK